MIGIGLQLRPTNYFITAQQRLNNQLKSYPGAYIRFTPNMAGMNQNTGTVVTSLYNTFNPVKKATNTKDYPGITLHADFNTIDMAPGKTLILDSFAFDTNHDTFGNFTIYSVGGKQGCPIGMKFSSGSSFAGNTDDEAKFVFGTGSTNGRVIFDNTITGQIRVFGHTDPIAANPIITANADPTKSNPTMIYNIGGKKQFSNMYETTVTPTTVFNTLTLVGYSAYSWYDLILYRAFHTDAQINEIVALLTKKYIV